MLGSFDHKTVGRLVLFAAVAEEGSLRRAASRLDMSQTALASQLSSLESSLGVSLLARTPRGVRLTSSGSALLPEVRRFMDEAEVLSFSARQLKGWSRGVVTVGAVTEAMLNWVPSFKRTLAADCPDIAVVAREIDSSDLEPMLLDGTLDFAIGHFSKPRDPRLRAFTVRRERPCAVLSRDHPLASREIIALRDLANEEWVLPARRVSPAYVDSLVEVCRAAGFTPFIRHEVGSTMQQIAYVCCGQGTALVPEFFSVMLPPEVAGRVPLDAAPVIKLTIAWNASIDSPHRDAALASAGVPEMAGSGSLR